MPVYVDDMEAKYSRMIMCHMVADTLEELHDMAEKIGVPKKWYQGPPVTRRPHYDICMSKKKNALELGAIQITMRETIQIIDGMERI